jgi:hypothetical protein
MKPTISNQMQVEFYSVPQLAAMTNESEAVWRKRILFKDIGYTKCGKNVRVSKDSLHTWLAARTVTGTGA